MLDARFSHLYFYQSLNKLQRGLSAIAELLVAIGATEALRANIYLKSAISLQLGQLDTKFQLKGVAPTNHSSQKIG